MSNCPIFYYSLKSKQCHKLLEEFDRLGFEIDCVDVDDEENDIPEEIKFVPTIYDFGDLYVGRDAFLWLINKYAELEDEDEDRGSSEDRDSGMDRLMFESKNSSFTSSRDQVPSKQMSIDRLKFSEDESDTDSRSKNSPQGQPSLREKIKHQEPIFDEQKNRAFRLVDGFQLSSHRTSARQIQKQQTSSIDQNEIKKKIEEFMKNQNQ